MKKNGFTLAEILISLGIIGVVAALTTPALIQDVSNAKIGPTLSKFKSSMENANRMIMQAHNTVDLAAAVNINLNNNPDYTDYVRELSEHLAGSRILTGAGNIDYCAYDFSDIDNGQERCDENFRNSLKLRMSDHSLVVLDRPTVQIGGNPNANSSYRGQFAVAYVDINGESHDPNHNPDRLGFDAFCFLIDRNGSLIPVGSTAFATYDGGVYSAARHWSGNNATFQCGAERVGTGEGCAGSIFDNNMKVIYK